MHFRVLLRNSRWPPKRAGKDFWGNLADNSANTLGVKKDGKTIFGKTYHMTVDTLGLKNFAEIALSRTISETNVFLCFIQKFKMAT